MRLLPITRDLKQVYSLLGLVKFGNALRFSEVPYLQALSSDLAQQAYHVKSS